MQTLYCQHSHGMGWPALQGLEPDARPPPSVPVLSARPTLLVSIKQHVLYSSFSSRGDVLTNFNGF